ncbi:pimeloyl-ACP methyl ester carboxylesterase [Saccharothrix tamanrassetensis]|uniref:Pimeloyl-ACP methyl ester carboxylesterase n=1 Tax=Saccharothrix tamanrassetensis TaxID=1051531 RepID=A0A841CSA7_9PSEU|nr:alpha/beta hydrolase [Saccharothrix tamanrassetensis]MBB5958336.1 pimeloyl-ACP methyl ester carboxylesterase [Saccharothrix tamanrassetensis]
MRSRPALFESDLTRQRIATGAGTFDAIATGPVTGRKVLLLHGVPECGIEWRHQLRALAAHGYRAVAPDLRGYSPGVRPKQVDGYRLEHAVQDVREIADALGWKRFDLVGHDWGAVVAWIAAARYPLRIRTLTAVSAPHPGALAQALRTDPDQQRRWSFLDHLRTPGVAERELLADDAAQLRAGWPSTIAPERVNQYVRRLTEPGALTAALNWYRANPLTTETFRPVSVPTRFLWGEDDRVIGPEAAQTTAGWATGPYWFEVMPGVGHFVPEEAAEQTTLHLLDHLATY